MCTLGLTITLGPTSAELHPDVSLRIANSQLHRTNRIVLGRNRHVLSQVVYERISALLARIHRTLHETLPRVHTSFKIIPFRRQKGSHRLVPAATRHLRDVAENADPAQIIFDMPGPDQSRRSDVSGSTDQEPVAATPNPEHQVGTNSN
jgi:hypothetical protein